MPAAIFVLESSAWPKTVTRCPGFTRTLRRKESREDVKVRRDGDLLRPSLFSPCRSGHTIADVVSRGGSFGRGALAHEDRLQLCARLWERMSRDATATEPASDRGRDLGEPRCESPASGNYCPLSTAHREREVRGERISEREK
ncbi:unnamed protein product [Leuciscus chuanchicus]